MRANNPSKSEQRLRQLDLRVWDSIIWKRVKTDRLEQEWNTPLSVFFSSTLPPLTSKWHQMMKPVADRWKLLKQVQIFSSWVTVYIYSISVTLPETLGYLDLAECGICREEYRYRVSHSRCCHRCIHTMRMLCVYKLVSGTMLNIDNQKHTNDLTRIINIHCQIPPESSSIMQGVKGLILKLQLCYW